jgi:hypothetical protein
MLRIMLRPITSSTDGLLSAITSLDNAWSAASFLGVAVI